MVYRLPITALLPQGALKKIPRGFPRSARAQRKGEHGGRGGNPGTRSWRRGVKGTWLNMVERELSSYLSSTARQASLLKNEIFFFGIVGCRISGPGIIS